MQTINRYQFSNATESLAIVRKFIGQSNSGCLQMFNGYTSWSIYLEEGKLIYASYSNNMFELIHQKLQQLNKQISSVYDDIYKRLLMRFETAIERQEIPNLDYLAICWLVNEKFISHIQAGILVEKIAIEIMESLLEVESGKYNFTAKSSLDDMPKFCYLDVNELLLKCNNSLVQVEQKELEQKEQISEIKHIEISREKKIENTSLHVNDKNLMVLPETKASNNFPKKFYQGTTEKRLYKIVCIDDSPTVLNSMKNFLDEEFFSVIAIKDPLKALMQIIRVKPDLILLDITMPNLDGYELCSLLRKHSQLKKTPIVMVTGRSGFIDRAKAKMVRSSGYLTKPFTQNELLKLVFQHLN